MEAENNKNLINVDGLWIDYNEMLKGIDASREDFKCGRYSDIKTSMEKTRKMLFDK